MRQLLSALLFVPVMTVASTLLDIDGCKKYYLSDDPSIPYLADPAKNKSARESHDKTISELRHNHDGTWKEWELQTVEGKRYYALCKQTHDPELIKLTSLECHGSNDFPLQNLLCVYDAGNKWYSKCTVDERPRADIRLYWEDMREYEEGENPNENMGYMADLKRFEMNCRQDTR